MKALIPIYLKAQSWMQAMLKDEEGATMVEYALMLALIAVVCITAVTSVGSQANLRFGTIVAALTP